MANAQIADRVRETTTTTGTGTLTLGGAVQGHRTFASAFTTGTVVYYCITNYVDWEVGYGTFTTSGNTLTRSYILSSSNSNAAVNFAVGTKDVFNSAPSDLFNSFASQTAITGVLTKSVAGSSNVTLTPAEYANGTIILTGALVVDFISIFLPNTGKWVIVNNTTGGSFLNVSTVSGYGYSLPMGQSRILVANGTNVIDPESGLSALYLGIGDNAVSSSTAAAVTSGGALNTPASGNLSNCTGYPGTQVVGQVAYSGQAQSSLVTIRLDSGLPTLASSTTPDIFSTDGNTVLYTGTATCTGPFPASKAGIQRTLICQDACRFTSSATFIIAGIPTGNTLILEAGAICNIIATSINPTRTYRMTFSFSGEFTTTGTGFTIAPTSTSRYLVNNGVVTLFIGGLSGTSNSNSFTITGLPLSVAPNSPGVPGVSGGTDNGVGVNVVVSNSGTSLVLSKTTYGGAWTTSGTKSITNTFISYTL